MCGALVTYRQSETHHLEIRAVLRASLKEMCLFFFISTKMSQSPYAWNLQSESELWFRARTRNTAAARVGHILSAHLQNHFRCENARMLYI